MLFFFSFFLLKGYPDPKCVRKLIRDAQLRLKRGGWDWRSGNLASLLFPEPSPDQGLFEKQTGSLWERIGVCAECFYSNLMITLWREQNPSLFYKSGN